MSRGRSAVFLQLLLCLGSSVSFRPVPHHRRAVARAIMRGCGRGGSGPIALGSLDDALKALHSKSQARADQEARLRKSVEGADETEADAVAPSCAPTVYLVGVGPGDVELLTVKALRLMQEADLVLYDRLITPEILALVGAQAAMLYVGKEAGLHTRPQDEIHELLLSFATTGKTVVRLKGGDPTVFGRGGEEMEYLERQGVDVRVVPGITAASGIAAALGVPLTHRDHADSVRFITGHARSENTAPVGERYAWEQLADPKMTLVIYMGLSTLPELAKGLTDAGLPGTTPSLAVQDGTTATQRVVCATLETLADAVQSAQLRSPTLIVIGQVVSLYDPARANAVVAAAASAPAVNADAVLGMLRSAGGWRVESQRRLTAD